MSDYLSISLYEDGVFVGRGLIKNSGTSGRGYVECDAPLGDEVYDAIEDELTENCHTDGGVRVGGKHYTWTVG